MTVKELLSFRRKNGLLEKVTVWKSCNENANEYEKIAEFNPGFYEAVSKEIIDLEIENVFTKGGFKKMSKGGVKNV